MTNKLDFTKFDLESYAGNFATRDEYKSRDGDAWFKCCFHEENTASLHITDKQVFHCHGCGANGGVLEFVSKVNKTSKKKAAEIVQDLAGQESVVPEKVEVEPVEFFAPPHSEAIYSYNDGYVLKYRLSGKRFVWCHYDSDTEKWWTGIGNNEVGLYAPNGLEGTVVIAEGEKDADTLCQIGFNGVSAPNGTHKWKNLYSEQLKDVEKVVILNDEDYIGIAGSQLAQKYLKDAGLNTKRISPTEIEPSDIDGYDITDVAIQLGGGETQSRLQALIDEPSGWDILWNETEPELEIESETETELEQVEVEIVWQSGLGEEYDNLINTAVRETIQDGFISELTDSEIRKYSKKNHVGIRTIKDRIKERVDIERPAAIAASGSQVMRVDSLGMDVDISGSGYTIAGETGAIWDSSGHEVIGHFLCFVGVVMDAEASQDTNVKVCLAYNTPQDIENIKTLIIPKKDLATTKDIVATLSGYNINVTQVNSLQVVQYLQDLQNHFSERTIIMKSLSRFGWYNDYLMPYEQDKAQIVFDSTVAQPIADKLLATKGSREKSLELIKEISQYSNSGATILGAAVGSLVLSYINDGGNQSFALNIWNGTGTGKSVTCQGVSSLFGYPFKDKGWWADGNATMNKDIYQNSLLGNLPTFIDDPARNRGYNSEQRRDYVFSVTSGQGRGRMQRSGDVAKDVKEWCNIMIMTNETLFIDDSIEDGGARSRCLEISFEKPLDQETAMRWIDIMKDNYGHFALDIAEYIRSTSKYSLNQTYKEQIRWFRNRGVEGKRANNAAIVAMGLLVANDALGLDAIDPAEWLVKQILGASPLSDGQRAYIKLMKRVEVSETLYRNLFDKDGVFIGSFGFSLEGSKVLNLPHKTLEKYGKEEGFNYQSLINWGSSNDKIVPNFDKYDNPQTFLIQNRTTSIRVTQFYYEWENPAVMPSLSNAEFETIDENEIE